MIDSAANPMCVALVPWLDMELHGQQRFQSLLFPAIDEALTSVVASNDAKLRVALALGIPVPRPGLPGDLESGLRSSISTRFRDQFQVIATFPSGHAAGLLGMYAACAKMKEGAFDACVVAGVESYMAPESLEWLEQNDQVHGAGPLNNAWGFIPGESAGAVLLARESLVSRMGWEPLGRVASVGRGFEQNRIKTETVCIGEGLTAAFREGLAGLPLGAKVTDVFCDMNGEPYRADEFGFACLRTKEAFESASDFVAPADCWGDVSAASGPLGIVLSTIAHTKAYSNGRHAFIWASSESGERAAALLEFRRLGGN